MKKIVISLLIALLTPLSSCFLNNQIEIDGNGDCILEETTNEYRTGNIKDIKANLDCSISFILYFTKEGCSSCEQFSPIMDSFRKNEKYLIYKFDVNNQKDEMNELKALWGDRFFKKENETYQVVTPSVYAVSHDFDVLNINYNSYMQTENAFKNYMHASIKISNSYLSNKTESYNPKDNELFISLNKDSGSLSLYNSKIKSLIRNSSKNIIINSDYCGDNLIIKTSTQSYVVDENTDYQLIESLF